MPWYFAHELPIKVNEKVPIYDIRKLEYDYLFQGFAVLYQRLISIAMRPSDVVVT